MNVLEYEFIKNQSNRIVGIEDLSDLTPRTLILGKTDAQHIYRPKGDCYLHIYIEDREIKRYIYDAETGEGVLLSINKSQEDPHLKTCRNKGLIRIDKD